MGSPQPSPVGDGTATCLNLLRRLFPGLNGERESPYLAFPSPDGGKVQAYQSPPVLPPDVFAAAAHLLDLSGAYHHVIPNLPRSDKAEPRVRRLILIEANDIQQARAVALAWRAFHPDLDFQRWIATDGSDLAHLFLWWREVFVDASRLPVFEMIESHSPPPLWWKSAVKLLMAADEASTGVGYHLEFDKDKDDAPWLSKMIEWQIVNIFYAQGTKIRA